MTFSKIAGGLLLLAALVPTTQATPAALRALQRNRRAGFCDAVQKTVTCSQQQASACTGDCAVNEEGECSLNPAVMLQSLNMQAMLAPVLACGLGGMGGEAACNNAYPGGMCDWTTNDDGEPTCSVHADKLVAAMGGGDPVMNDMLTASVTCDKHGSQNHCSADSNCQYDGNSCGPNVMAFMSKCATSGGSNGGGSGAGDKCKGLTKMGDLYLPCAGKDKAACGAVGTCSYQEEDMECTPSVSSSMQAMMSDKDVQAAQQYIMAAGSGCDTKGEAACQADAKCDAGLEQRKSMTNSCRNDVCTSSTQTTFAKTCETNVKTMLEGAGCGGSVLAMYYRIEAANNKVSARKANAAKDEATAAKPKLVDAATAAKEAAATKKAAYDAAKKAADACSAECDQLTQAAASAELESQNADAAATEADAAVASNDAAITSATSAATKFEADEAAAETNAANSPASRLASSAAAVFAAAAAAAMTL